MNKVNDNKMQFYKKCRSEHRVRTDNDKRVPSRDEALRRFPFPTSSEAWPRDDVGPYVWL